MTLFPRSSGVLLHPTSLPGRYGIGDLGEWAYRFVDWLVETGQSVWQVLPLGPTGYADSPYQSPSTFAGNPNLVSLDKLVIEGWLTDADLADVAAQNFPVERVDYGPVIDYKQHKLKLAFKNYETKGTSLQRERFDSWCKENESWLEDYALFAAIKDQYNLQPWWEWDDKDLVQYNEKALAAARKKLAHEIEEKRFLQWLFFSHWADLRRYANERGVRIVGDIPIYVAHDSSDVWSDQQLFHLDENGNPMAVAGVPPDYFSADGQLWGNPLYKWDLMEKQHFAWWIRRIQASLKTVDILRIDHFRAFYDYWRVPAGEETAINGEWVMGPGSNFFEVIKREMGELPIIAEDLGDLSEGVYKLRDEFDLPGMKVLQFAWSEPTNPFLPHNHVPNCIVYTGTHDNNTTVGWWLNPEEVNDHVRNFMADYMDHQIYEVTWSLIKLGMSSPAHTFIAPMQDILGIGVEGRMNTPGTKSDNWQWRMPDNAFTNEQLNNRLAHNTWLYRRRPDQQEEVYGDPALGSRS